MQNSWLIRGLWSVNTNLIKNDDKLNESFVPGSDRVTPKTCTIKYINTKYFIDLYS